MNGFYSISASPSPPRDNCQFDAEESSRDSLDYATGNCLPPSAGESSFDTPQGRTYKRTPLIDLNSELNTIYGNLCWLQGS
jgi:hypothetical protein